MTRSTNEEIHNAIQNMDVPAPRSNFFDDVDALLAAEPAPSVDSIEALDLRKSRTRSIAKRSLSFAIPAVAASVALFLVINQGASPVKPKSEIAGPTVPPTGQTAPPVTEIHPILASEVLARANNAFANLSGLSGTIEFHAHPSDDPRMVWDGPTSGTEQFRMRSNGDYWYSAQHGVKNEEGGPEMGSYNAATGVLVSCWEPDGKWYCNTEAGIIDGSFSSTVNFGVANLANSVREDVVPDGTTLDDATFEGHDAWKLVSKLDVPKGAKYVDTSTLIVDKQTGIVLQSSSTLQGKPYVETTIHDAVVNPTYAEDDFKVTAAKGVEVQPAEKVQYTRTTIDKVKAAVGYLPVQPTALPTGFTLAEVSTAKDLGRQVVRTDGQGIPTQVNEQNRNVVVMTYRRGLEAITVTTRPVGSTRTWFEPQPDSLPAPEPLTKTDEVLTGGVFAGVKAQYLTALDRPRLWGVGKSLVFQLTGDVTHDELVAAANSMS